MKEGKVSVGSFAIGEEFSRARATQRKLVYKGVGYSIMFSAMAPSKDER